MNNNEGILDTLIKENKIKKYRTEISSLKSKKMDYEQMRNKMNNVLNKIKACKEIASRASTNLSDSYTGEMANKKINSISNINENFQTIESNLENSVLPEIERILKQIDQDIQEKENSIKKLQN